MQELRLAEEDGAQSQTIVPFQKAVLPFFRREGASNSSQPLKAQSFIEDH